MSEARIPQKTPYKVELEAGDYWWCSCGRSAKQPFCDGSHEGTGYVPIKFTVTEKSTFWLCGCKQTQDTPFCDGNHNKLP